MVLWCGVVGESGVHGSFLGGKYNLLIRGKAGNRKSLAFSAVRRQTQTQ